MNNNPKVSIIIPAYNASGVIAEAIQSVQAQTWQTWELIIINDGSTDNTDDVVNQYLNDPRIIYFKQENKGCSAAKNTGLALASGQFIQYLDADDFLSPDKINEQVSVLNNDPWAVAVCRTKTFVNTISEPNLPEIDTNFLHDSNKPLEFVLNLYGLNGKEGMIQPNAFLISSELAREAGIWDTALSPSPDEDGEYFCRVMLKSKSIYFTPNGINYYRKNAFSASLSKQTSHLHAKGALRSLEKKAEHLWQEENSERVAQVIAKQYAGFIYLYHKLFPDLTNQAEFEISQLRLKRIPLVGGKNFQRMAKLIGFKNALILKKLVG
ncbi:MULTISPECIES: glycosyltransferase family 2 protein [Niastella]|uniref:Glycosyltransferase n=1 Tax=Niastella soli TaxID=2821487 RepID=A0ABS3YQJ1_9BACT|nr:glycosyltransferase family 2 protein [Niastella soli]MBO9200153.1 glycosyltransferase [Niastella soli]